LIHLTVVTPERKLVDQEVDEVVLPGTEGYFGVLEGHAPFLTTLRVGRIEYRQGGETSFLSVAWGFVEVLPKSVRVLADIAERAEDIDVERAKEARGRAEERMRGGSEIDWDRAAVALEKAVVRLQVAEMDR
jgi:F-type H+-transporting ATPase subunit epsilon